MVTILSGDAAVEEQMQVNQFLDNWFRTPQGLHVALAFANELKPFSEQFNGETLLQLGSCGDNIWLPNMRFKHQWIVNNCTTAEQSAVVSSLTKLPIDRNCIDCIIAPLTIELGGRNKALIDEMDRVLNPMGFLIVLGINPVSLWGCALRWGKLFGVEKSQRTASSSLWVKRALLRSDYRCCAQMNFYYIPPVVKEKSIRKLEFLNEMGKMIWPFPAGFYCLIVQKYQACFPNFLFETADAQLRQSKPSLQVSSCSR